MYKLKIDGGVVRIADNAHIPKDPNNMDYAGYVEWVEAGNVPYVETPEEDNIPILSDAWDYLKSLTGGI